MAPVTPVSSSDMNFDATKTWIMFVGGIVSTTILVSLFVLIAVCACCGDKNEQRGAPPTTTLQQNIYSDQQTPPPMTPGRMPPTVASMDPRYKTLINDESFVASSKVRKPHPDRNRARPVPTPSIKPSLAVPFYPSVIPPDGGSMKQPNSRGAEAAAAIAAPNQSLAKEEPKTASDLRQQMFEAHQQRVRDRQWRAKHRQMVNEKKAPPPPPPPPVAPMIAGVWEAAKTVRAPDRSADQGRQSIAGEAPHKGAGTLYVPSVTDAPTAFQPPQASKTRAALAAGSQNLDWLPASLQDKKKKMGKESTAPSAMPTMLSARPTVLAKAAPRQSQMPKTPTTPAPTPTGPARSFLY